MRLSVLVAFVVAGASVAWAARPEVRGAYLGWGGPGEQNFRSKVSIVRNNPNLDRAVMVIVDDMPRRGARIGIARVAVTYSGGRNASATLLKAIHQKPYEYTMVKLYKEAPLSPKIARVVLPCAQGVIATFRFYKTLHTPMDRTQDKGLVDELTCTFPADQISALPLTNPMRDRRVRKPRKGEDDRPPDQDEAPEGTADAQAGVAGAVPTGGAWPAARVATVVPEQGDGTGPASDAEGGRSRDERAMARARQLAARLKASNRLGPGTLEVDGNEAPAQSPESDEEGLTSVDGVSIPSASRTRPDQKLNVLEDTPEMIEAQRKAMERIRKMGLGQ